MISESSLGLRVFGVLARFFKFEYTSNYEKANIYVSEVLSHVKKVVAINGSSEQEIDYSHEVVKKLYASVGQSIGNIISANDLAKIHQALAAARLYYWIRRYKGRPGTEVIEIINERSRRIMRGGVRHSSNEHIIQRIIKLNTESSPLVEHEIQCIHATCLSDIAELESLHLNVVLSNVKKW